MPARKKVKGLYLKDGWWYFQPGTNKTTGVRPKPVALRTRDYVEAVLKAVDEGDRSQLKAALTKGTLDEVLPKYYRDKADDGTKTRRDRELVLSNFSKILGNPKVASIRAETMMVYREHLLTKGGTRDGGKPVSAANKSGKRDSAKPVDAATKGGKGDFVQPVSAATDDDQPKGGKPVSAATVKTYLITVKAFLNWARAKGYLDGNPMEQLNKHTRLRATKLNVFHTEEERDALLAEKMDPQVRLIFLLGYYQGLREGEILTLAPAAVWISPEEDRGTVAVQDVAIEFTDGTTATWRPKGRRRRILPMHAKVLEWFKEHGVKGPWVVRPDKVTFPKEKQSKRYDSKRAIATVAKRAKVAKAGYHVMRHSFGTHLAMKDVPLATIAALLGDSLKVTEDHYAGFSPSRRNPLAVL